MVGEFQPHDQSEPTDADDLFQLEELTTLHTYESQ
jgi:hypothetical protein